MPDTFQGITKSPRRPSALRNQRRKHKKKKRSFCWLKLKLAPPLKHCGQLGFARIRRGSSVFTKRNSLGSRIAAALASSLLWPLIAFFFFTQHVGLVKWRQRTASAGWDASSLISHWSRTPVSVGHFGGQTVDHHFLFAFGIAS